MLVFFLLFIVLNHSFSFQFYQSMKKSIKNHVFTNLNASPFDIIADELDITYIRTEKSIIQVHALSDLHADSKRNQDWVENNCVIPDEDKLNDDIFHIMIVPGDVGSELESLNKVFQMLVSQYDAVCYCVGNHECWRRGTAAGGSPSDPSARDENTNREAADSIVKIVEILKCAKNNGLIVGPLKVCSKNNDYGIYSIPIQSWYHSGWDIEPDLLDERYLKVEDAIPFDRRWGDFAQCVWPGVVENDEWTSTKKDCLKLSQAFGSLNECFINEIINTKHELDTLVTFSHFVPRIELCPEKRFLIEPNLSKVVGSVLLEEQIRLLQPSLHLFGHTHIAIDLEIDDIRYVQWPLGYQRESTKQCYPIFSTSPLKLIDSRNGQGKNSILDLASSKVKWTEYYRENQRDPNNQQLSPWLLERLSKYSGFVDSAEKDLKKMRKKNIQK